MRLTRPTMLDILDNVAVVVIYVVATSSICVHDLLHRKKADR